MWQNDDPNGNGTGQASLWTQRYHQYTWDEPWFWNFHILEMIETIVLSLKTSDQRMLNKKKKKKMETHDLAPQWQAAVNVTTFKGDSPPVWLAWFWQARTEANDVLWGCQSWWYICVYIYCIYIWIDLKNILDVNEEFELRWWLWKSLKALCWS